MARGTLRIYLGWAPGVGKTHAMLDEGHRRAGRGATVHLAALRDGERAAIRAAASDFVPLDHLDTVAVGPGTVVLVDDLARDDGEQPRWEQVARLLDRGADVVTTLDLGRIESMSGAVAAVVGLGPGAVPDGVVPDSVVRSADQIELVDIAPEALRRRLAHGHVFPADQVDAVVMQRFRPEVLLRLRHLALAWMADRVAEQLAAASGTATAAVGERVVVALGGEGGDRLVARATRLAGRIGAELVGVHVVVPGARTGPDLERQRQALAAAGGRYREVMCGGASPADIASALTAFVGAEHGTQLVIGTRAGTTGASPVLAALLDRITDVDLHLVPTGSSGALQVRAALPARRTGGVRRRAAAWAVCLAGLPLVTVVLSSLRSHVSVGAALLIDLAVVVAVAALGGLVPGLVASVTAFALTNWFITPPLHTLKVSGSENVVALTVFVLVTVVVSVLVDRAARRSREALMARAEAGALARSAATLVGADDPLPELVEQVRATFGLRSVAVFERSDDGWWPTQQAGDHAVGPDSGTSIDLSAAGDVRLVVEGEALRADQLDVLRAFGDQLAMAVEARRLRVEAANADLLAQADALRASLLRAVSHDFRTPLATITASASGLLQADASFSPADRRQLLAEIVEAADRLERMVRDLLDLSRLQAGAVELALGAVALEDVVAGALGPAHDARHRLHVDVSETVPLVLADRALLERAVANLVSNALAWSPDDRPVRVEARQVGDSVVLQIVDRGPGVPPADRERMFVPFQRLGDRSRDAGAGLGLAIANGFVEAMGGRIEADDTPGGGLTMSIVLSVAGEGGR